MDDSNAGSTASDAYPETTDFTRGYAYDLHPRDENGQYVSNKPTSKRHMQLFNGLTYQHAGRPMTKREKRGLKRLSSASHLVAGE